MQFSADYFEKKIICAKMFSRENIQQDDARFLLLLLIHRFFSFPSDLAQTLFYSEPWYPPAWRYLQMMQALLFFTMSSSFVNTKQGFCHETVICTIL